MSTMNNLSYLNPQQQQMAKPISCVFNNLGVNCDKKMDFGCFCSAHMAAIFHMGVVNDVVQTKSSIKRQTKQILTQPTDVIMPFPFVFKPKTDNNSTQNDVNIAPNNGTNTPNNANGATPLSNYTYCLDEVTANNMVSRFVSKLSLRENARMDVKNSIITTLISLLCNGTMLACDGSGANMSSFLSYMIATSNNYRKQASNKNILVLNFPNDGVNSTIPLSQLPFLYLVLFQYCEMSTIINSRGNAVTFSGNLALDYNSRGFITINETPETPFFYLQNNATYASPLIMAGTRTTTSTDFDLFNSSVSVAFNPFQLLPTLCSSNNGITINSITG